MAIEYYSFGTPHPAVDMEDFKACIEENIKNERGMKNLKDARFILIHNPRINNMLVTDIDLLLIIAVENKDGNYLLVERKNNKNILYGKSYFYNMVFPIKFIEE